MKGGGPGNPGGAATGGTAFGIGTGIGPETRKCNNVQLHLSLLFLKYTG